MNILVTGASGFVGNALVYHLDLFSNHVVYAMVRGTCHELPAKTEQIIFDDIGGQIDWSNLLNGIDVIIHCAGRAHVMDDKEDDPIQEFRRVNTKGTLNLARHASEAGVKRFVFLSSIKVNGESTKIGCPFDLNSPVNASDPYGISKAEAEAGLRKIANETGLQVTIIRPPLVYGRGVKGNFRSLIRLLSAGIPLPFGLVKTNRRSFVALDNLVSLLVLCIENQNAVNQTFLVSDGRDLSTTELLSLLRRSMGSSSLLIPVPQFFLKYIAYILRMSAQTQRLLGTLQVDISHTRNQLGWEPLITIEEGMKRASQHNEIMNN